MGSGGRITGIGAVNERGEVMLIVLPLTDKPERFVVAGSTVTIYGAGKELSVETYSERIARQAKKHNSISICEMTAAGKPTRASEIVAARG